MTLPYPPHENLIYLIQIMLLKHHPYHNQNLYQQTHFTQLNTTTKMSD